MSWLWWLLVGWVGVAVVLSVVIGKAIAGADLEEDGGHDDEAQQWWSNSRAA